MECSNIIIIKIQLLETTLEELQFIVNNYHFLQHVAVTLCIILTIPI